MSVEIVCSAKGCKEAAVWAIQWRNPKIHDESRRKTWSACEKHRDHLRNFLAARSFPLEVVAIGDAGEMTP